MKLEHGKNKRRPHPVPIVFGIYAAFLGVGLIRIGLSGTGNVGHLRLLLGLGMFAAGLMGIWDGVRDWIRPEEEAEPSPARQFILTDSSGGKSSNVTIERIREQLANLAQNDGGGFHIQLLPPADIPERGALGRLSCAARPLLTLTAFFEKPEGGWRLCKKIEKPDMAEAWFRQFLTGSPDFSGWEAAGAAEESKEPDKEENQVFSLGIRMGKEIVYTFWHQLLVISGESWRDEHRFFTGRDVELAVEGVSDGTYQSAALEWGIASFTVFPGPEDRLHVSLRTGGAKDGVSHFYMREGTAVQVKFWLLRYLNEGYMDESWQEVTGQIKKEWRRHLG